MSPVQRLKWPAVIAAAGAVIVAVVCIAVVVCGVALLYAVSPEDSALFPACPIRELTGLNCPGCGTLRAVHALLHGRFLQAAGYNCFVVCSLPCMAAALAGLWMWRARNGGRRHSPYVCIAVICIYLALCLLWGVVRNVYGW